MHLAREVNHVLHILENDSEVSIYATTNKEGAEVFHIRSAETGHTEVLDRRDIIKALKLMKESEDPEDRPLNSCDSSDPLKKAIAIHLLDNDFEKEEGSL